jgi:uncharacterized alpha-E superfamily protein
MQARIARAPGEHAAMGVVQPSLAPWVTPDGRMEPRPVAIRLFLLFDGEAWQALPGGLARALSEEEMRGARLKLHAPAKDVWIAAEEEEDAIRGPADIALAPLAIRRGTGELPSRVADNFFWLGRYLERLEAAARLLRTAVVALERPAPTPREMAELRLLAACLASAKLMEAEEAEGLGAVAAGPLAAAVIRAARDGGRLPAQLAEVSRLAFVLRDRLTGEVHDTLAHGLRALSDALRALPPLREERRGLEPIAGVMTSILTFCAAVSGLASENMVRGGGRLFLDLGRRIERAWAVSAEMARLLDEPGAARQPARLEPGLRLALDLRDSVITYRSRYLSVIQPAPVLDLVLADEGNPRGLAFQLRAARDLLAELTEGAAPDPLTAVLDDGLAEVARIVGEVAAAPHQAACAAALPARLRALEAAMAGLSDSVARRYFALLPAAHAVGIEGAAPTCGARREVPGPSRDALRYGDTVDLASHMLHLRPRVLPGRQRVVDARITAGPEGLPPARRHRPFRQSGHLALPRHPAPAIRGDGRGGGGGEFPTPPASAATRRWEEVAAPRAPRRPRRLARGGVRLRQPDGPPPMPAAARLCRGELPGRPARCSPRCSTSTPASAATSPSAPASPRSPPRSPRCWPGAKVSARISPT